MDYFKVVLEEDYPLGLFWLVHAKMAQKDAKEKVDCFHTGTARNK
jgi:hypothetical protein